jgi:hypothetical protein
MMPGQREGAAIFLRYGNFDHALHDAAVAISKETLTSEAGQGYGVRERWRVTGFLQAADQASLSTAIATLQQAYSFNYRAAGIFLDNGTATPHQLPALSPIGGTRVVEAPSFPDGGAATAEYTTFRTYSLTLECESVYPGFASGLVLLSWVETLAFQGGGPRFVHLQPLIGLPQKQLVATSTPYRVTQSGEAVGLGAYPNPPFPIWPEAEHVDRRRITPRSPKAVGGTDLRFRDFPINWSYEFESVLPLSGQPTTQPF